MSDTPTEQELGRDEKDQLCSDAFDALVEACNGCPVHEALPLVQAAKEKMMTFLPEEDADAVVTAALKAFEQ